VVRPEPVRPPVLSAERTPAPASGRLPTATLVSPAVIAPPPAPAPAPRASPKPAPPREGVDTGIADAWFADDPAAADGDGATSGPILGYGPQIVDVDGEVPIAPEPIPGVFDDGDESHVLRERIAKAQNRQIELERRQRRALWAVVAMATVGLLAIGAIGAWVFGQISARMPLDGVLGDGGLEPRGPVAAEAAPPEPSARPAPGDDLPAPAPEPEPVPEPEPPLPVATDAANADALGVEAAPPSPAPVAERVPPKPKPKPKPDTETQINRAWAKMDRDAPSALALFDAVLKADGRNIEAMYGRGYALLQLGRRDEALGVLCKVLVIGASDQKAEVDGTLKARGLKCP
jgi:hypothetical protein